MKRFLLIGREGQVAHELRRSLACLGLVAALDRRTDPPVDLADLDSLRRAVQTFLPDLIINAAAYTAVDKAEQEPELAFRINGEAPGVLAEEGRRVGAGLIHYSTDYVFTGDAEQPYSEKDAVGPLGVYGRSKLAGEEAIRQVGFSHMILRTAWVYGGRGQNFLLTMLRLMREREVLKVVDDQRGAPTWSRMIAEATAFMVARTVCRGPFALDSATGVYHLTCGGQTTWHGFAARIRKLGIEQGLLPESCARLEPIPTSSYPTPARRPAYSVLSNDKLRELFKLSLPEWEEALAQCMADFQSP
jgi:dTDP-4-dehydrorhamnose reductase